MHTETLNLTTTNGPATAYVARPQKDATAAVVLIQEWWGINDHIRDIAGRYADEGYLCVAPDLYRGKVAIDPDEAARLMKALTTADGLETISKAIDETHRAYSVQRIGITGYCMGGTFTLRAACELPALRAFAAFYGDIPDEQTLQQCGVPGLFFAGERDAWINPEKVNGLRKAVVKYSLPIEVISYDADHAFFNDTRPQVYDAAAAADAWQRVLAHFRKHLLLEAARSA